MQRLGKCWPIFLALAALLVALAVACAEEEEEATPTPAGTPTATVTGTTTPTAEVPGITATEIVLGAHVPLAGVFGAAFRMIPDATQAYFNYINDTQGGVCGRKIVYKMEDNQNDAAQGLEAARKLVERDQVFALVGSLGDDPEAAAWDYVNEQGVPDILVSAGAHRFGIDPQGHPWTITLIPSYTVEGTFLGEYISENLPDEKVAALYENGPQGWDELAGLKKGLDPDKNELVSEQSYESTAVDIRSQVTNMKNAGVEVVHGACIPGHCAQAIKAAHQMDWDVQFFIGYVNSDPAMFMYSSPEAMEGVITLQAMKLTDWTDDPVIAEHHRIMSEHGDLPPGTFTLIGQGAALFTVKALRATCDNLTREGLMDAIHSSFKDYQPDFTLPGVTMTLSPTDHLSFEAMRMLRATLVDGKGKYEYFGEVISFRD